MYYFCYSASSHYSIFSTFEQAIGAGSQRRTNSSSFSDIKKLSCSSLTVTNAYFHLIYSACCGHDSLIISRQRTRRRSRFLACSRYSSRRANSVVEDRLDISSRCSNSASSRPEQCRRQHSCRRCSSNYCYVGNSSSCCCVVSLGHKSPDNVLLTHCF